MRNYSSQLNQTQQNPLLGRNDMIKNNAGGYGFQITAKEQLVRFLLCGSENGTYYASETKLTEDNAKSIVNMIQTNGLEVVRTLTEYRNRVPKVDTVVFVLALATTYGNQETKNAAYNAINTVCRTATQLFTFVANVNNLRGWSAGLRRAVSSWYTSKTDDQLSYQLVKYRNRAGYTHRDVLRLAHPKALTDSQNTLFKYAVDKITGEETNSILVRAFTNASKTLNTEDIVLLIKGNTNLTWEMIPTELLNNKEVLTALLDNMPTQALIRNLNRFSKAGLTDGNTAVTKQIRSKLNDEAIVASCIHPLNLVNSMLTYAQGHGDKGSSTWSVNQSIVDTLNEGYYSAVKGLQPTGKDILIALDVSGSMNSAAMGSKLSASQLGALVAVTTLKVEANAELIGFDTTVRELNIGRRTGLDQVIKSAVNGGGTDCSVAFQYALSKNHKYDAIIILTDNETWAGKEHSLTLLNQYRKINPNVKVIEIAMAANPHSTLPNDKNVLRIVGFDSAVPQLINEFIG